MIAPAHPRTSAMHPKRINQSKRQRRPRPSVVTFEITFVAVGAGCGMIAAVVVEAVTRPNALYMLIGALAGMIAGALAESARFGWRKYRQREDRRP